MLMLMHCTGNVQDRGYGYGPRIEAEAAARAAEAAARAAQAV